MNMNKATFKKIKSCAATREVFGFDTLSKYINETKLKYTSQGFFNIKATFIKGDDYSKNSIIFEMFDNNHKKIEITDELALNASLSKQQRGIIHFNTIGYKFVTDNGGDSYYCDYEDFLINDNIITIKSHDNIKITLDIGF